MSEQKPLIIKMKLSGGKESVIPFGVTEELKISVIDEIAMFHFNDSKITKKFVDKTKEEIDKNKENFIIAYSERRQKAIYKFPNMKQMEIIKKIKSDLEDLKNGR